MNSSNTHTWVSNYLIRRNSFGNVPASPIDLQPLEPVLYYPRPMPDAPRKPAGQEPRPSCAGSLGFGLMLVGWWLVSIELPGRNLFFLAAQRGIERQLAPITIWAFGFTQAAMTHRWWAVGLIVVAVILHRWLRVRRERWDIFGKWVFKAAFLVLYIILYGLFMAIFLGAELPIWMSPSTL
jgi:hypothetical protein